MLEMGEIQAEERSLRKWAREVDITDSIGFLLIVVKKGFVRFTFVLRTYNPRSNDDVDNLAFN